MNEAPGLETLAQDAPIGLAWATPGWRIIFSNQTFRKWTGDPGDGGRSAKSLRDLLMPGSRIYFETHIAPLVAMQGAVSEIAIDLAGPAGPMPVLLIADMAKTAQGPRLRIVLVDVRERRHYEAELQAARARAEASERDHAILAQAGRLFGASLQVVPRAQAITDVAATRLCDACTIHLWESQGPLLAAMTPLSARQSVEHAFSDLHWPPSARGANSLLTSQAPPWRGEGKHFGTIASYPLGPDGQLGLITYLWRAPDVDLKPLLAEYANLAGLALGNARAHETAGRAIAAREELVGILGHEFGNPLTVLQAQVALLRMKVGTGAESSALGPLLANIERQLNRMRAIVADMGDLSRIRSGRLRLVPKPFDLAELARDVLERTAPALAARHTRATLDANGVVTLVADAGRVEQVLTNLLSNAAKYGEGSPVEVIVSRQGDVVRIAVCDHGPGIPAGLRAQVFERFERLHEDSSTPGSGLGLYIVRHIVHAHGGRIWADETPGGGATFVVELPASPPKPMGP